MKFDPRITAKVIAAASPEELRVAVQAAASEPPAEEAGELCGVPVRALPLSLCAVGPLLGR